jgi:sulfide:quinone oxidoreductase
MAQSLENVKMEMTQLAPNLFVAAQIARDDLAILARDGFTDVVCNRPDAEHPEDPDAAAMAETASGLQLRFHYQPIVHGEPFLTQAQALKALVAQPEKKVLAYCRSGARSTRSWDLARSELT